MNTRIFWLVALLCLPLNLFLGNVVGAQAEARARFIHAHAGAPAIDLYINGELALEALVPGAASSALTLPAGSLEVSALVAGEGSVFLQDTVPLAADAAVVLAPGAGLALLADDLSPLEFGKARILIFNAFADGVIFSTSPLPGQPPIGEAIALGQSAGPFEVAAGGLDLAFVPGNGDRSALEARANLHAGTSNILVVRSAADKPELLLASAPTDGIEGAGRVSFAHAVQGAAAMDLVLDDTLIVPGLSFASASPHIAVPAGEHELSVRLGTAELATIYLQVRADEMGTVALLGSPGSLHIAAFADDPLGLEDASAALRLINGIPSSTVQHLRLEDGAAIAEELHFAGAAPSVSIPPGAQAMSLSLLIGDESGLIPVPRARFYGGAFYNLFALSGGTFSAPRLLIAESGLERRISALMPVPEEEMSPAMASEEAAIAADDMGDAEDAENTADAAEISDEPEASAAPSEDEAPPPAAAAAEINEPAVDSANRFLGLSPHASVALDPSANLQLRQYPSSRALSLGLLTGGSDLMVLGRRGPSVFQEGETADVPVDLSDLTVDPAQNLNPYQDLAPEDTWLYVMYETPDGGALYGWVNAFYLNVYDEIGDAQRLRSLALVRQNYPGSALHTSLRPPELSDHISVRVSNLDANAFLNIRAGNDVGSEVLGHLPPDARVKLIGLDLAEAWVMIEYEEAETITRGWVSADFVELLLNNSPVTVSALRTLDPTVAPTISDWERGRIRIVDPDAPTPVSPPEDMMSEGIVGEIALDPGAMLHLRRYPDATSESLALLAAGSKMLIGGMTENGEWFRTNYLERDGWLAAQYVKLLLRGRVYARDYVMSLLPVYDDLGFGLAE